MTKNKFANFSQELTQKLDDWVELQAGNIERSAAMAAPYEFGVLQNSISVSGRTRTMGARTIIAGAEYAFWQHEGTSRGIDPNPFLKDAVEYWRNDFLDGVRLLVN